MRKTVCGKTGFGAKLVYFLLAAVAVPSVEAVTVSSVTELQTAIANATTGAEIVIAASGSPYDLSTADCMSRAGHLYAANQIILRGSTGNPSDVVLVGSTNRILYCLKSGNVIRDLTFKNGNCTKNIITSEVPEETCTGGAICLRVNHDETSVSNCIFTGNTAVNGGAVANYYAAKSTRWAGSFEDCIFTNNTSTSDGGAAAVIKTLRRCVFLDNRAEEHGGALYCCELSENCAFTNNNATSDGGAIYCTDEYRIGRDAKTTGSLFSANTANRCGGGACNCTLIGCTLIGNGAQYGGGADRCTLSFCTNTANWKTATTVNCGTELYRCAAKVCVFDRVGCGGSTVFLASSLDSCRITLTNGFLVGSSNSGITNCLIESGSNFYWFYNPGATGPSLVNCTVVSNRYLGFKVGKEALQGAEIVNCFFYGNSFADNKLYDINSSAPEVVREFRNCLFKVQDGNSDYAPGSGNYDYYSVVDFKPGFVGAAKDPENPYAITRKSPAFHENSAKYGVAGDAAIWSATDTDFRGDGFLRLRDGKVDIGCYQCWLNPNGMVFSFR